MTDEAGNTAWCTAKDITVKDVTKPTLNGTPTAAVNGQSVTISWNAASDNLAIKGYYLTVDGNKYTVTGKTSYTLNDLSVGNHTFALSAYDAAGNESSKSASKSFTIAEPADTVKPTISKVTIAQGVSNYTFTATVTASDNKTATANLKYKIKYAATQAGLTNASAISGKSFTLNANAAGKTYYYQVGVTDEAGNTAWCTAKDITVKDVTKPTLNGTPTAAVNGQSVTISWNAASDNLAIKGYYLTVDGNKYTVTGKTSYTLNDLSVGNHTFALSAYDAAGNESSKSASKSFTIAEPADTVKPTISKVTIAQGVSNYTFTATVTASDNKTATANLKYKIKYAATQAGLTNASAISGKSFTLNANAAGKTYYYQVGVTDEAGNTTWCATKNITVKDVTKPTISKVTIAQGASNYTFTATVTASDNKTAAANLKYKIKYAATKTALSNATAAAGKKFTLANTAAGKTYYYQVGVTDEAGNTVWCTAKNITVKDVTKPTLNGTPTATVKDQSVTIKWSAASDNLAVKGYYLTVDGKKYSVTGTSYTINDLAAGNHTFTLSAYDAAGNESSKSASKSFTIAKSSKGSIFQWSGSEYVYVQENGVTKSDFVLTTTDTGESDYMWTNEKLIDAEKDSETMNNYYLYMNTCWAATASNMFVRAGWSDGIFATEDIALKYFCDNLTQVTYEDGSKGVSGGWAEVGCSWLLSGYNNEDWNNSITQGLSVPKNKQSGGFYKQTIGNSSNKYISTSTAFTYSNFVVALQKLQDGYSVGLGLCWCAYDGRGNLLGMTQEGHAITVYGFTYDKSKKGTPGYFTGVLVADSDDDKLRYPGYGDTFYLQGTPASTYSNRVKKLELVYDEKHGGYVFNSYGFSETSYGFKAAIITDFQYLAPRPNNVSYSLNSGVGFAKNADWNAAYSVSISKADALNGNQDNKRITAADDIYVAVNLSNSGLGNSDSFKITAVIDEDVEKALTFNVSKVLAYGESDDQTVINLGKLSKGIHNIELTVTDGDITNSININNLYVAYANLSDNKLTVNAGQSYNGSNISADQSLIVMGNGSANGTVITANGEQVVKANGCAEQSKIYANGMLTVENGGSVSKAEVFAQGFLIANGNVNKTTVHAGGALFADQNSNVQDTTIEAEGWMDINYQGNAANTDVHGNLMVTNGTAEDTTVFAGGTFMVVDNGVSDGAAIQNNAKQYVADGGNASNNTFSGALSEQYVFAEGSVATGNTFDAGAQIVASGGLANNNTFNNGAVQDLSEGAVAVNTTLNGDSSQYIWKAAAYNTTVNAGCMSFVLEGGISTNCTVKSEGYIILGDLEMFEEDRGVGATKNLTVEYGGYAMLEEGAVLYGTTTVAGSLAISGDVVGSTMTQQDASPVMVFDFTDRTNADGYMVSNISLISDLTYNLVFDDAQANGTYKLAANGGIDFNDTVSVYDDEGIYYGALTLDDFVLMDDQIVTLKNANGALDLVISNSPYKAFEIPEVQVSTNGNNCTWGHIAKSDGYIVQFSRDNFQTFITVKMSKNAISIHNLHHDLQWRVKTNESEVWTIGKNINANAESGNNLVHADKDWKFDMLFASSSQKWNEDYNAKHQGSLGSWKGTGEKIALDGKNIIADVFEGTSDANVLLLTDTTNGDALFADDIYTSFGKDAARIAQIDEIRAGAGADIVDLTSQKFAYVGEGVKVYGGLGNDTIWANKGKNLLFGDAGNDRIVGGSDDDVIIGGSGNDSMHGGGGDDIFCFGGNWGKDTITQLADGKVTVWFEDGDKSKWNASTLTYTDGTNSVKVTGIASDKISLKFGGDTSDLPDGAFAEAASEKIFEDKNKGMLA